MSEMQASDSKLKEQLVSELSAISFRKDKSPCSKQAMSDLEKVITQERTGVFEKNELKKALEGKTPQEQAKIINDYIAPYKKDVAETKRLLALIKDFHKT